MAEIVDETRKRSLVKTITLRIFEVAVDTALIAWLLSVFSVFGDGWSSYLVVAILIESLCALTSYLNERLWNRVQWGRRIKRVVKSNV
jgi:uncharacterized membrane protein